MDTVEESSNSDLVNEIDPDDVTELCFPKCDESCTPRVGQVFSTLEEGMAFYDAYAKLCGFDTRKSTQTRSSDKTILLRYMLCNREGLEVKFVYKPGHTYTMVSKTCRYLMKSNREVDYVHQMFIMNGIKANIGPMKTFYFFKELIGNYESVGCTVIDFKNYARDLRVFFDGSDAHILLENFKVKKEDCSSFQFSYKVDEANRLKRLFWADEISVKNFKFFGDAVSFDATYQTNRYKLIFTPFTGRDNHGRCVTFGAAIISNEDVDAYSWVLQKFVDCMGSHPSVLTTDQDPALKKAIASVLPSTTYRLCMWHIMMKVAEKLPVALRDDSEFKYKFSNVVWSDIHEPNEFEEKWHQLIDEYDLGGHRWFCDMYELRDSWIPAYFRNIRMNGLFCTTSLSESENNFFRRYLNKNADLVHLYMHYCSAMDAQRSNFNTLTLGDETSVPDLITELTIERHAASIYTMSTFKVVQVEIVAAAIKCVISAMYTLDGNKMYDVDDSVNGIFKISYNSVEEDFSCSCKLFIRKGLLCRHVFFVMCTLKMKKIPDKYILDRWSKTSLVGGELNSEPVIEHRVEKMVVGNNDYFLELCKSIASIGTNVQLRDLLLVELKRVSEMFLNLGLPTLSPSAKKFLFVQFYGGVVPEEALVKSPPKSNTKGSGVGGRRIPNVEKAILLAQKPKRKCSKCNCYVHHDARTCTQPIVDSE